MPMFDTEPHSSMYPWSHIDRFSPEKTKVMVMGIRDTEAGLEVVPEQEHPMPESTV